jgi:uracil-DNA glycosylase family 4
MAKSASSRRAPAAARAPASVAAARAAAPAPTPAHAPGRDCPLCPRLVAFREEARRREPTWHNAPVPTFGPLDARLLIVGLAPGLRGANRTGRPFTGDWAGDLLFETLLDFGFATGVYDERPDDGLELVDCRIVNSVRCVPPQNKPTPAEIATCRAFLTPSLVDPAPRVAVALGRIAHESALKALGARLAAFPFAHGAAHDVPRDAGPLRLYDSYHCSRYNTNTGVLTRDMFRAVFAEARAHLDALSPAGR